MKAYIAGAIFGIPVEARDEAFARAEGALWAAGIEPLSPLNIPPSRHTGACPPGRQGALWEGATHTDTCYLKEDLRELLECEAIALLPGWTKSWGARLEAQVAMASGLAVFYFRENSDGVYTLLDSSLSEYTA